MPLALRAMRGHEVGSTARPARVEVGEAGFELLLQGGQFREARPDVNQPLLIHLSQLARRLLRRNRRRPAFHQRANFPEREPEALKLADPANPNWGLRIEKSVMAL